MTLNLSSIVIFPNARHVIIVFILQVLHATVVAQCATGKTHSRYLVQLYSQVKTSTFNQRPGKLYKDVRVSIIMFKSHSQDEDCTAASSRHLENDTARSLVLPRAQKFNVRAALKHQVCHWLAICAKNINYENVIDTYMYTYLHFIVFCSYLYMLYY